MRKRPTLFRLLFIATLIALPSMCLVKPAHAATNAANAEQAYADSVRVYQDARQTFATTRTTYLRTKKASDKVALLEAAQTFVNRTVSAMQLRVTALRAEVNEDTALTASERTQLLKRLATQDTWIKQRASRLSPTTVSSTKNLAQDIRANWTTFQRTAQHVETLRTIARVRNAVHKARDAQSVLEEKVQELKEAKKPITSAASFLATYSTNVSTATTEYDAATSSLQGTGSEAQQLQSADTHLAAAKTALQQSIAPLKKTITAITKAAQ